MFQQFEISAETLFGLKAAGYEEPTEIQKQVLEPALKGRDILGSAKTGSGKTLAFVIPLLECLHREKWSHNDGLGALVVTPTRELAYQIFEVLRLVGQRHQFSAALIIGGKDLAMERKRVDQMNIIICTPGRLQQHMEENPLFRGDNLRILVIDEADRILDQGFKESMNSILDFLPIERQCLLFSATQTNSVEDLARVSLRDPITISIDEDAPTMTPDSLKQKYTVINLEQKLSFLWAFIKRRKKSKILVFIATCKQTRFINDLFCRMKPGISINALHGGLHQLKRMDIYNKFRDVRHCVLLATDVAARGLDFPEVDWVVQLDCPDNATTYIHRVGRTARLDKPGRSILILMPNERKPVLDMLTRKKILIEEVPTRDKHLFWIENSVQSHLAKDVNLKEEAKRAFSCYVKSLLNSRFKHLFDPKKLDLKAYAKSLGLEVTPRIRKLERCKLTSGRTKQMTSTHGSETFGGVSSDEDDDNQLLRPAKKQRVIVDDAESEDDNFDVDREMVERSNLSKAKLAKKLQKKNIKVNKHIVFD